MEDDRRTPEIGVNAWLGGIVIGLIGIALLIAAYSAGYDEGRKVGRRSGPATATKPAAPARRAAPTGPGRALFATSCGSCHTLAAAGTSGKVGPSLDELKPDAARVGAAIANGGTGSGAMPADLLTGADAKRVADYVAAAAGAG